MRFEFARSWARSGYPTAVAAGLLLAAAFPKPGLAGLAWIAPALMLAAGLGRSARESFRIGYVAGLAYYLASLHWLLCIPVKGFPILGWVALSAYLALYPAVWVALCIRLARGLWPGADGLPPGAWLAMAKRIAAGGWTRRFSWALGCAVLWVALEMLLSRLLGGFPWDLLGVSQSRILPLIQLAAVAGVYGVSFLVAWTSAGLLCAALMIVGRPEPRSAWSLEISLPLLAVAAAFVWGAHRLEEVPGTDSMLRVTLVQPSIPQTLIWDTTRDAERFAELSALSEAALARETDLLIWPEAATPGMIRYEPEIYQAVTNLAVRHGIWMIVGSDDAERAGRSQDPNAAEYYNSSFLVSPRGDLVQRYRKRSLVIFGEYIPFEHTLPFVKWLTPVSGSFTPGTEPVSFVFLVPPVAPAEPGSASAPGTNAGAAFDPAGFARARERRVKTSTLICFEDVFPHLAREYVDPDTDFLVNLTNDGWFGESAAQWQHAMSALFRAVENGVPLIRCTNNGLTCWIDRHGRVRQVFADATGSVYGRGFMHFELPLADQAGPRTFYHRHGDWFGWSCVIGSAAVIGAVSLAQRPRRNSKKQTSNPT